MLKEEIEKRDRAVKKFQGCDFSGSMIQIAVDRKQETQTVKGYCDHKKIKKTVSIDPACLTCFKYRPKENRTVKTERIKRGRKRQQERQTEKEDWKIKKPTLDRF